MCICHETNVAIEYPYKSEENCNTKCPGHQSQFCGNQSNTSILSFYCVRNAEDDVNCTRIIPAPDHGSGSTATPETTMTTEESTSTLGAATTESPGTTTDDMSTGEPTARTTEDSNTDRTVNDPITTPPTVPSTVIAPTKPLTCQLKCNQTEHYGEPWAECAGKTAVVPCPEGAAGFARWNCLRNGTFEGAMPDYSNCSSLWFDELLENLNGSFCHLGLQTTAFTTAVLVSKQCSSGDQILHFVFQILTKNGTLPVPESKEILERLEKQLRPTDPNVIPYYGHEITKIYEFMYRVVNATRGSQSEQWEVIQRAMAVPGILLTNQRAWQEIQNVRKF